VSRGRVELLWTVVAALACMTTACRGAPPPIPTATFPSPAPATRVSQPVDLLILYTSDTQGVVESTPLGGS